MFGNVNLEDALNKERARLADSPNSLLNDAKQLLAQDEREERAIEARLKAGSKRGQRLLPDTLDQSRIYNVEEIRSTCIKYRLRFLDSKLFKAEIPYEATATIKAIQRDAGHQLANFRIMAPARLFELGDCNEDPLLFAQLADGRYYLIHKWGNDLAWHRKLLAFPFRSLDTLAATVVVAAVLISLLIPSAAISETEGFHLGYRVVFFLWAMIGMSAVMTYVFFTFNQNFSVTEWNSRYFNS